MTSLQDEYSEFIHWLQTKTTFYENLIRTKSLPNNFADYLAAKGEADARFGLYSKLKNLVAAQHSVVALTPASWQEINQLWNQHQFQLQYWLWMLDSNLPGDFGAVGKWLAEAEKLLYHDEVPTEMNEETAAIISKKLEEHKQFFGGYEQIKELFYRAKQSPLADRVPLEQLRNMEQRLNDVGPKAQQRRIRLKFLEHKCCLIAFLNLIESKLRQWNGKNGREDRAVQLLEQYRNFVHKNKVFQEFGKAFVDMQHVVEEYKRDGNISRNDFYEIDKFMRDTEDRWKRVSMELRCCQNMLEEVVTNWKRWNSGVDEFEGWLCRAEEKMRASEDERLEFFQDITTWKDKHQQLHDTVNFLVATCEEPIGLELRNKFGQLSARFDAVFAHTKQYMYAGDILRNRQEYRHGCDKLTQWLNNADAILAKQPVSTSDSIRQYGQELQQLAGEIDDIEELFKHNSKIIQSLIPDMSRDEVDKMMTTLKQQKDALVRIRSQIPIKLHLFHQLLAQQESLEQGQKEIHHWLDEAEQLLSTLTLTGDRDHLQGQLDKHRGFFSRTLFYRSMVESKNNVFQNLLKSVATDKILDTSDTQQKMKQLNDRFNYVSKNAEQWEQRLSTTDNCWDQFRENERIVTEWIYKAEVYLIERHIESKKVIEDRKTFFESVNERWMDDLVTSGQNLLQTLPLEEQQKVVESVENLQKRWKDTLTRAPPHLMRLQFNLDETNFNHAIKDIEKEILAEQQALNRNEDVEAILKRNQEFFRNKPTVVQIENCLENMKRIAKMHSNYDQIDTTLNTTVQNAEKQWEQVSTRVDDLRRTLQQIPAQWDSYHDKFNSMIGWMNNVDQSLKSIVNEVNTMEEFEKERLVFQVSFYSIV